MQKTMGQSATGPDVVDAALHPQMTHGQQGVWPRVQVGIELYAIWQNDYRQQGNEFCGLASPIVHPSGRGQGRAACQEIEDL